MRAIVPSVGFDARWYEARGADGASRGELGGGRRGDASSAVARGVSGIITNEPGAILRALHDTRIRCERENYW